MKNIFILLILICICPSISSCQRTYKIPTTSMEPTFSVGKKLSIDESRKPNLYEVAVFTFSEPDVAEKQYRIGRVAGKSGDTMEMRNGLLFVNGKMIDKKSNIKFEREMEVKTIDTSDYDKDSESVVLKREQIKYNTGEEKSKVTAREYIRARIANEKPYIPQVIGTTNKNGWNRDNWGPIIIPKKGEKLVLTETNFALYANLILYYENINELSMDSLPQEFTIQNNYYFFLGDNRHNSYDSRYIGFIPEENIIGVTK